MGLAILLVFVIVAVAGFGLVGTLIVLSYRRAAQRRTGMAELARAREWEYRETDPTLASQFTGAPFGKGRIRGTDNVLIGRYAGRPFTAFDYWYRSGGEDTSTSHYSVIALRLDAPAPDLAVGPATTLGRWVDSLTGRHVAIGDPEFDASYTVRSPAPEFARDVLLSEVRDVLRQHPQLSWRISRDSLLAIRSGHQTPAEVDARLQVMAALLDRIPDAVWDRLRGEATR